MLRLITDIASSNDDERPRAYVVLKNGMNPTIGEITTFINSRVSYIKRVSGGVAFIDAIPKNPSGKILRNILRERAKAEATQAASKL
jgi:4-coumarate--CoA ligase